MWMGITLLPFIDRERLIAAMAKADRGGKSLTAHEKDLNSYGEVTVFVEKHDQHRSGMIQAVT